MDGVKNDKKGFPMLIPYEPEEFWNRIREIVCEEVTKLGQRPSTELSTPGLTYKPLYKIEDICIIFMITKPTVYEWIKLGTLRPFKVHSRVYFLWEDIQQLLRTKP